MRYTLGICLFNCVLLTAQAALPWYDNWPAMPAHVIDQEETAFVESRLSQMTTEEKVAQMLMLEHNALTVEEAKQYKIGGMLHGAGQAIFFSKSSVSTACKKATYLNLACWGELADAYWDALLFATWHDAAEPIPVLWGTDAMHGAGAIHGATLFPQNIGIGAAMLGDPSSADLIEAMYAATREQVALQGFRQIFSPTVAVARNTHWGRTYESYGEDPALVYDITPLAISGLQQPWEQASLQRMAATLKHFIGDGGTTTGTGHRTWAFDNGFDPSDSVYTAPRTDRGINEYSEDLLLNLHASGYIAGIEAGALSVMVSFNAWDNGPIHGDHYLIQDILKDRLQFDGIVVTDWDAFEKIPGCSIRDCVKAVNAGIDMFMISYLTPNGWQDFYHNTLRHIEKGDIKMSRIDDAVRRILRVKYRLGLFNQPMQPSQSYKAFGYKTLDEAQASLDQWQSLSKALAQKSMVLMKNEHEILPLDSFTEDEPLLVAGSALDSPQMQQGGWSLQWQGFSGRVADPFHNKNDYPHSVTVLDALKEQHIPICIYAEPNEGCEQKAKIALVVMGEHSYAEWYGDIHAADESGGFQSIAYASIREQYAADESLVKTLKQKGYRVITVFYSGRPLVVEALNISDAFVAAFLPGSQAGPAVVDLLFAHDGATFEGRLPMAWPSTVAQGSTFHHKPSHFLGDINAWQVKLNTGKAREVTVTADHPYPYGFGF